MPMLVVTKISRPLSRRIGSRKSDWTRSATNSTSPTPLIPSRRIVNSSPPRRASTSPVRRHVASLCATDVSS